MAYEFSGVFIRTDTKLMVPEDFGYPTRNFSAPFQGLAIRFNEQSRPKIPEETVNEQLSRLELGGSDWLYIEYCTWAGELDSIRSFGRKNGKPMQIYNSEDLKTLPQTYLTLMAEFGIDANDAQNFAPFVRGFWS